MSKISLTVKIWLSLSLVSLLVYLVVIFIMPFFIRNFFTDAIMQPSVPSPEKSVIKEPVPFFLKARDFHIRGFIILEDGTTIPSQVSQAVPAPLVREIMENSAFQQTSRQLYEYAGDQESLRYVVEKSMAYGHPLYQVTFIRTMEEDKFVRDLLFKTMLFTGIVLIMGWFASLLIVRYLTRPLTQIEKHVNLIANRNWHDPLDLKQDDEIGKLACSIETMRQQLVRQDEAQQSMLQNVSHELKTPVMVIRSYAQAIQDGVYPKGGLAGSIQVIDEEGARLEKLVKQLLYLTRLDYLATQKQVQKKIQLNEIIEKIVQRLYLQRPEVTWQLDLEPATTTGDEETLRVMIENLLENHLRHASSCIEVNLRLSGDREEIILSFWNDGSKIEPHIQSQMFQPFHKGQEGKFGLGLTIVERIVKMSQGRISLKNERNGVSSTVILPPGE